MANTYAVAAAPIDVRNFLLLEGFIDRNSRISYGQVQSWLAQAEGRWEERTKTALKPKLIVKELHDLEATRSRHPDLFDAIIVPRPIHLYWHPVIPFAASRSHKIEVYAGAEPWEEWLSMGKTEGRNADYWCDYERGHLFIRKAFIPRRSNLVNVTYEAGKLPATLTVAVDNDDTTLTVASTAGYQERGWVRLGDEYMFYSSKTDTQFNITERGYFDTDAQSHAIGAELYQVDDGVRELIIMYVAAKLLRNEAYQAVVGEGAGGVPPGERARQLEEFWEKEISGTHGAWSVF